MLPVRVPYCEPKCTKFKLVVSLKDVRAECVRCNLHHDVTIVKGHEGAEIEIEDKHHG